MANNLKINLIVMHIILLLEIVKSTPQVSVLQKCKKTNHTIYFKQPSMLTCPEEETVNLSGLNLSTVQTNFVRSLTIENILLNRNNIRTIPYGAFKHVPKMKCVNLARNKIPYEWLMFVDYNLKTLILDYQTDYLHVPETMQEENIWDLSKISWKFPNLESLSISGNGITSVNIPFESFPQLSVLYLSDNNIQYIDPLIFKHHPQLRIIHLEGNEIEALDVADALNLEELYLDRNPITDIRIESFNQSLKILSVSECSLKQEIYIFSPSLKTLDMSRNQISKIQDDHAFMNTVLLENLNLMYNNISSFPYLKYLNNLKRLFLDYNNISLLLPNYMPGGLKTLSLEGNQIEKLEKIVFVNLEELEELNLSSNKLESLPIGWQDNLKMLRHLNLMWNRFTTIADMGIGILPSLKELCVANNLIENVDLNSLQILPQECTVYAFN